MTKIWTPAERVKTALTLDQPDEIPTFELEFQLSMEFFGYELYDDRLAHYSRDKFSPAD